MRLIGLQYAIAWQDKPANQQTIRRLAAEAQPESVDLLVLPEMAFTGFSMDVAAVAETDLHDNERFLSLLARDAGCHILAGLVTRETDGKGVNAAVLFGPDGEEKLRYEKLHPFSYGGESAHYRPGKRPQSADWQGLLLAPFICYDLRFPEIFRWAARRGAGVFPVIANWPKTRQDHWKTLLRARAIENQAYVIGVNRVGNDPSIEYAGGSLIIDPKGNILAEADHHECVIATEIDPAGLRRYREKFPALRDMRPPLPED